jgi:hypothetical protein
MNWTRANVRPACARRVLLVGAERNDEFADAERFASRGHSITVINPRKTAAARRFQNEGGRFVQTTIENLAKTGREFDVIRENYPYPLRNYSDLGRRFAMARLTRLAPAGRWILFTESPRLASALAALAHFDLEIARRFNFAVSRVCPNQAPSSVYPVVDTRFQLVFRRC